MLHFLPIVIKSSYCLRRQTWLHNRQDMVSKTSQTNLYRLYLKTTQFCLVSLQLDFFFFWLDSDYCLFSLFSHHTPLYPDCLFSLFSSHTPLSHLTIYSLVSFTTLPPPRLHLWYLHLILSSSPTLLILLYFQKQMQENEMTVPKVEE